MANFLKLISLVLISLVIFSCQSKSEKKTSNTAENISSQNLSLNDSISSRTEIIHPGKIVYDKYCLTCHQADGSGVPNMHPPLGPGSWMNRDSDELIAIMMKGLSGKIEVNGEIYNSFMPSHAKLTNEEIADVLSFIRVSFGNNLEPISASQVEKYRKGK